MAKCASCGREIGRYEEFKKARGAAYCNDCRGPRPKPDLPKDARGPGKPVPRKKSFGGPKKPELKRLGAGWRCQDCGKWVTGPEHMCAGKPSPRRPSLSRTPSSKQYEEAQSGYSNVPPPPRARSFRPSLESKYSEQEDDPPYQNLMDSFNESQFSEMKEEERRGSESGPRGGRAPLTPAQRQEIRRQAAQKVVRAAKKYKALREIGYDVDAKEGFVPVGPKGGKNHKHLEPDYVYEAIDPEHRFGHFLNILHKKWLANCEKLGGMSFWEYIDQDAVREEFRKKNIVRYIKKKNLHHYKIDQKSIGDSLRLYRGHEREPFDTTNKSILWNGRQYGWAIYVQDPATSIIYTASAVASDESIEMEEMAEEKMLEEDKRRSVLHHSSFLGGKPLLCAGEWIVQKGQIISVSPMTGHYKIKLPQFMDFLVYLEQRLKANLKDITVKWPWPQVDPPAHPDPHYYNAFDLLHMATHLEFMCEPYRNDRPLPETAGYDKPREVGPQDPRSGKIEHAPTSLRPSPPSARRKECPKCGYPNCVC